MWAAAESLVADGTITVFVGGLIIVEVLVLSYLARRPALPFIANGVSGFFLILALHSALSTRSIPEVAMWLGLGGIAHIVDLVLRLRQ